MELEVIMQSKTNQAQKDKVVLFLSYAKSDFVCMCVCMQHDYNCGTV
jgi:hypothetical protein